MRKMMQTLFSSDIMNFEESSKLKDSSFDPSCNICRKQFELDQILDIEPQHLQLCHDI